MNSESLNTTCPIGGHSDQIQKVTTILAAQSSATSLSGYALGGSIPLGQGTPSVNAAGIALSGTSQTYLVSKLMPPPKPVYRDVTVVLAAITTAIGTLAVGPLAIGCVFGAMSLQYKDAQWLALVLPLMGLVWLLLLMPIFVLFLRSYTQEKKRLQARFAADLEHWERAMSRWNCLYYCFRDDVVFERGGEVAVQSDQMITYLFS